MIYKYPTLYSFRRCPYAMRARLALRLCKIQCIIREISLNYGANVPFLRNKSISGDLSPSSEYINHAIDYFEKIDKSFQNIVILQPTSPLRTKEDIISSINLFDKHNEETLISAYVENHLNDKATYNLEGLYGKPNSVNHGSGGRRQDDETIVVRNGAIYIFKVKDFIKREMFPIENSIPFIMKGLKNLDLDEPKDLISLKRNIKKL